ncbi:MAG TPA: hypothetical protein VN785_12270 [Candidatus Angelobacter sp.]|nr:hypothetical protein [Candidatus Angelobacter sp.]
MAEPISETPSPSALAAIEQPANAGDEKDGQKAGAVREAAHAAAEVEADAATAAANAEREAAEIAKDAGEKAAQKWLEQRFAEIETKAESRLEALKTWFEQRLVEIEGKKKEPTPEKQPEKKAEETPVPAAQNEPQKRKRLRI